MGLQRAILLGCELGDGRHPAPPGGKEVHRLHAAEGPEDGPRDRPRERWSTAASPTSDSQLELGGSSGGSLRRPSRHGTPQACSSGSTRSCSTRGRRTWPGGRQERPAGASSAPAAEPPVFDQTPLKWSWTRSTSSSVFTVKVHEDNDAQLRLRGRHLLLQHWGQPPLGTPLCGPGTRTTGSTRVRGPLASRPAWVRALGWSAFCSSWGKGVYRLLAAEGPRDGLRDHNLG